MQPRPTAILALLLACAPAAAQDKHLLRFRFVPDHVVHTMVTQDMVMNMSMAGQNQNTTMSQHMWTMAKTKEVKDGTAAIEQTVLRIKAKMAMPMLGDIDYDSDDPESDPGMLQSMAELVGKTTSTRVDASGKVLDFKLPEELEGQMRSMGMDLKQAFTQGFTALPEKPIGIGETWETSFDMPMGQMGKAKAKVTNKLKSVEGDFVSIDQEIAMTLDGGMLEGMKVEITKAAGTNKIDLRSGAPVEMTMDMEMKMDGGEDMPMKMTMAMKQAMRQVEPPAKKEPAKAPTTGTGK